MGQITWSSLFGMHQDLFIVVHRRIPFRARVSWSTVLYMLHMSQWLVILDSVSKSVSCVSSTTFEWKEVFLHPNFSLTVTTIWTAFRGLLTGYFLTLRVGFAWWQFATIVKGWYNIHRSLWRYSGTLFLDFIAGSVLHGTKVKISAKKWEVNCLFDNPLAVEHMSKNFAMWASDASPITCLRHRSTIVYLSTLHTTD